MGREKLIPQPPHRRPREIEMLDEAAPEVACVLWQFVRHARDWVEVKPAKRPELFNREHKPSVAAKWTEAQNGAPEIAPALASLASLTRQMADVKAIAGAADLVARWADERGFTETAIQLAEAAANLDRSAARFANLAGRLTRKAADLRVRKSGLNGGLG
jgi:hypothetical protein